MLLRGYPIAPHRAAPTSRHWNVGCIAVRQSAITPDAYDRFPAMDEYWIGSPRDAAARKLGQDAARSFFDNPVDGETMESFVLGDVLADIAVLTRTMQKAKQGQIKEWRRRRFYAPIALALTGIVTSIATTPRADSSGSSIASTVGLLGLAGGVVWLIVNAFRANKMFAQAQEAREAETGHLLTVARESAAAAYLELGGRTGGEALVAKTAEGTPVAVADGAEGADSAEGADGAEVAGPTTSVVGAIAAAEAADGANAANAAESGATAQRIVEDDDAASPQAAEARRAACGPPPAGQPFGVSQEGAGYVVAAWMRHLGEPDAGPAGHSATGGIGAASARYVAKVRNDSESVSVDEVRELVEAAVTEGRRPLFFASGSYEKDAASLAEEAAVTLFTYDAVKGTLEGANALGRSAVREGIN